jgi:hypothetical protein
VRGRTDLLNPDLVCIFVVLKSDEDAFYILSLRDLQDFFHQNYKGGRRPKNPQWLHCAASPKDLTPFRDNWTLLERTFEKLARTTPE